MENYIFNYWFACLAYMVLALQLHAGFPPFYNPFPFNVLSSQQRVERLMWIVLPYIFGLMVAFTLAVLFQTSFAFLPMCVLSIWCGLRIRHDLLRSSSGPLPWMSNSWTPLTWFLHRNVDRPMLIFDAWTIGISLMMGLLAVKKWAGCGCYWRPHKCSVCPTQLGASPLRFRCCFDCCSKIKDRTSSSLLFSTTLDRVTERSLSKVR